MRAILILVLLAGCMDAEPPAGPDVTFVQQDSTDRLEVAATEPGLDWNDLRVRLDGCTGTLHAGMVHDMPRHGRAAPHAMPLSVGDHVQLEGEGECRITLEHMPTNSHVGRWTFQL